jgi:MoaA/NifB/PqqE/SkfB family radical SAM enzyme
VIDGLHFLLTYRCTHECDHCFLHCGPHRSGTFTPEGIGEALNAAARLGTVEEVYFEGGEPFLAYPVLVTGVRAAHDAGLNTGIVTNSYWAENDDVARAFLEPLIDAGLDVLTVSDDAFHYGQDRETPPVVAQRVAKSMGLESFAICIPHPDEDEGVRFRGRAADKLTEGRPRHPASSFVECPDEDLVNPGRVHLDALGNVHLCQGLVMGNTNDTPLDEIVRNWDPTTHAIAGPLLRGGPEELARSVAPELLQRDWVSACHLCYRTRERALSTHPGELGPPEVYQPPS